LSQGNESSRDYVLGVDVGGTNIHIGKANRDCVPLKVKRYATDARNQEALIAGIMGSMERYLAEAGPPAPRAVGMGLVGHVSVAEGVWENAINISVTRPVPLCATIRAKFGLPAYIDNDVNMAALAEMTFGAGKSHADFAYINIGTGISAGLVSNGKIVTGASNYAGELGHMVCDGEEHVCKCGRKGCLEPLASGGGMIEMAKKAVQSARDSSLARYVQDGSLHAGTIFREAEKGDPIAGSIAEKAMSALENAVVNLVNLMNPSLVVFGGGAIEKDFILNRLTDFVYQNALPVAAKGLQGIRISALDPSLVGLIGASRAAWDGLGMT